MIDFQHILKEIKRKNSFLCIGLDSDINKIPFYLNTHPDPVFEFNRQIVDATHDLVIAYKPNFAFYETLGADGWHSLRKTAEYIRDNYPDIMLIADAKRGDIGNTSKMYAEVILQSMPFDAVTVAPYMGKDSVQPFLEIENKWVILLALTSNEGAYDFQFMEDCNGTKLYEKVIVQSLQWAGKDRMMYVIGATKAEMLADIRKLLPDHFLLVPGIGAQGGSLSDVVKYGMTKNCGLIVNNSRSIIYAGKYENFASAARDKTIEMQQEMKQLLAENHII